MPKSETKKTLRLPKPKKGKGIGKKIKKALAIGVPLAWTALGIAGNVLQGRQDAQFNAYHDALAGGALSKRAKRVLKYSAISASVVAGGVLAYLYGPAVLKLAGTKLKAMGSYLPYLPFFMSRSPTETTVAEVPVSEVLNSSPSSNLGDFTRMLDEYEAEHGPIGMSESPPFTPLDLSSLLNVSLGAPLVASSPRWTDESEDFAEFVARAGAQDWQPDPEQLRRIRKFGQGMGSRARHLNQQSGDGMPWEKVKAGAKRTGTVIGNVLKTGAKVAGATLLTATAISSLWSLDNFYKNIYDPEGNYSKLDHLIARNLYGWQ